VGDTGLSNLRNICKNREYSRPSALFFDIVFTLFAFTPRNDDNVLVIKSRDEILPFSDCLESFLVGLLGAGEEILLDISQESRHCLGQSIERYRVLLASVSSNCESLILCNVLGADLESDRNALFYLSKVIQAFDARWVLPFVPSR
jgi:hypothetical protein